MSLTENRSVPGAELCCAAVTDYLRDHTHQETFDFMLRTMGDMLFRDDNDQEDWSVPIRAADWCQWRDLFCMLHTLYDQRPADPLA